MLTRIITAVVALCVFIPVIVFASVEIFGSVTILNLAIAVITVIAITEAANCIGQKNLFLTVSVSLTGAILILTTSQTTKFYVPVLMLLLLFMFSVGVIMHKSIKIDTLLIFFAFSFYIITGFGSLLLLFFEHEGFFFPLVFVGAWITDTFAYFSGYFFGKHKLIPEVSPKKTVEGACGGTLFCMIGFVLWGIINSFKMKSLLLLSLAGFVSAVVSQFGDLSASLIKRHYGIKDYGKIFPGHGGILDRFDSILAVSAFLYIITELPIGGLL